MKYICKNCKKEFSEDYRKIKIGNPRFCSFSCSQSFSAKRKRLSVKKEKDTSVYQCQYCNKDYIGHISLKVHESKCLENPRNKGNLYICKFCNKEFSLKENLSNHQKYCLGNPNRIIRKGHPVSEETKRKISEGMKTAAKEGRNKGWATTKNKESLKSYPEIWFSKVIENEIEDKNYIYNMPFFTWKLDFAWPLKKICVEIDGSQHLLLENQKESDKRKDSKLESEGWTLIRGDWTTIFSNPKGFIDLVKKSIDSVDNLYKEIKINKKIYYIDESLHLKMESIKKASYIPETSNEDRKNYLSQQTWEERKNLILTCGVDLTEWGYMSKVISKTGLSKRQIEKTIKKFHLR